jgi:hypothetical protein
MKKLFLLHNEPGYRVEVKNTYNTGSYISNDSIDEMWVWCRTNCMGRFHIGIDFGRFELEEDATLFKLRWL